MNFMVVLILAIIAGVLGLIDLVQGSPRWALPGAIICLAIAVVVLAAKPF